jgi:hypothetical protein
LRFDLAIVRVVRGDEDELKSEEREKEMNTS